MTTETIKLERALFDPRHADARRVARTMFALVLEAIHDVVLGRAEALTEAEFVWEFCWHGVGCPPTSAVSEEER